ncbi:MAG: 16S rRNA (adenine(1518)-N(6)/adenine(1519)-N(6))-dimethyltransferase RsmA [Anaerolineae bacterium]
MGLIGSSDLLAAKRLLDRHGLRPKKGLGQNFLTSRSLLDTILRAAEPLEGRVVLEVGPGLGALTLPLSHGAKRVVAVEVDGRLIPLLREALQDRPNVELVQADILERAPHQFLGSDAESPWVAVGNLPYYLTSHLLRHLLEVAPRPERLVVTVQLEVAQRLVAAPGDMSVLAVSAQYYGRPRIVARARPGAFYPSPKVTSAVVRIDAYDEPPWGASDVDGFFRLVRAGFTQRRKYLRNALRGGWTPDEGRISRAFASAGIEGTRRAQTLTVEEWARLHRAFEEEGET